MKIFLVVAVLATAIAAGYDWKKGEIPGRFSLGLLLGAPIAHVIYAASQGAAEKAALQSAGVSLLGALVCGLVPFLLYRYNAIGGGDLKFFLALGALLMPQIGLEATFITFVAAAVFAPVKLIYDGKLLQTLKTSLSIALNAARPKDKQATIEPEALTWFRLGPCMFVGTAVTAFLEWRSK